MNGWERVRGALKWGGTSIYLDEGDVEVCGESLEQRGSD
jgi:hypothetical protein